MRAKYSDARKIINQKNGAIGWCICTPYYDPC